MGDCEAALSQVKTQLFRYDQNIKQVLPTQWRTHWETWWKCSSNWWLFCTERENRDTSALMMFDFGGKKKKKLISLHFNWYEERTFN